MKAGPRCYLLGAKLTPSIFLIVSANAAQGTSCVRVPKAINTLMAMDCNSDNKAIIILAFMFV
jgi:hypothetical protein